MELVPLTTPQHFAEAAHLAHGEHARLHAARPWLPTRVMEHYVPRIAWVAEQGTILGVRDGGRLSAFLGGFAVADFRHAGPGAFCPDWCHGSDVRGVEATESYRYLYRSLAGHWAATGLRVHAAAAYATDTELLEALVFTGFGRIVEDAARSTAELGADLAGESDQGIRPATCADVDALAEMEEDLSAHLRASPIFLPRASGRGPAAWAAWLATPGTRAWLALDHDCTVGYIKAQDAQTDVTDAVHDPATLAVNGLFVRPETRGQGLAPRLLAALARAAAAEGRAIVSVDCETANLEGWRFWRRWFVPLAYGHERRL
jgi:ribosomal protein S18 acetylase RimI-like enzyme